MRSSGRGGTPQKQNGCASRVLAFNCSRCVCAPNCNDVLSECRPRCDGTARPKSLSASMLAKASRTRLLPVYAACARAWPRVAALPPTCPTTRADTAPSALAPRPPLADACWGVGVQGNCAPCRSCQCTAACGHCFPVQRCVSHAHAATLLQAITHAGALVVVVCQVGRCDARVDLVHQGSGCCDGDGSEVWGEHERWGGALRPPLGPVTHTGPNKLVGASRPKLLMAGWRACHAASQPGPEPKLVRQRSLRRLGPEQPRPGSLRHRCHAHAPHLRRWHEHMCW